MAKENGFAGYVDRKGYTYCVDCWKNYKQGCEVDLKILPCNAAFEDARCEICMGNELCDDRQVDRLLV